MPTIYYKDGIEIRMNTLPEHPPPHVHVYVRDDVAVVEIETGNIVEGSLRSRDLRKVRAIIAANRESLLQSFRNIMANGKPVRID